MSTYLLVSSKIVNDKVDLLWDDPPFSDVEWMTLTWLFVVSVYQQAATNGDAQWIDKWIQALRYDTPSTLIIGHNKIKVMYQ